ncbi:MAG TPA: hypothetical protein VGR78_17930 [Verrucomicrobiae bacterium]|jgi:hypothetical protein|nr:hypothetical protein [Verrucomicrobiae bacterium]
MSEIVEIRCTPAEARELFALASWGQVRMISFDADSLEVLLKDNRRVRINPISTQEVNDILQELHRDYRDDERGL